MTPGEKGVPRGREVGKKPPANQREFEQEKKGTQLLRKTPF